MIIFKKAVLLRSIGIINKSRHRLQTNNTPFRNDTNTFRNVNSIHNIAVLYYLYESSSKKVSE